MHKQLKIKKTLTTAMFLRQKPYLLWQMTAAVAWSTGIKMVYK